MQSLDVTLDDLPDGHYALVLFDEREDLSTFRTCPGTPVLVLRLVDLRTWWSFELDCGHMRYVADLWQVVEGHPVWVRRLADQMERTLH